MAAPNSARGKVESKRINSFSPKRLGIKRANTVIFGAVATAAVVVVVSAVLLNFLWDLRGFNNRVIAERTVARDTLDANLENIEKLETSFLALEQGEINSQVVLDALPSRYDYPALATSVDKQVEEDGLVLNNIQGDDLIADAVESDIMPEAVQMPFSINLQGDYEGMVTFIQNLEKTIRPMSIDAIELNGTDDELRAQIRMHTYYQPSVSIEVETETVR